MSESLKLFLCGDVMTGRGIDQILPVPSEPRLFESYMTSALGYVELAERFAGPLPRPVPCDYIWGDTLLALDEACPDARICNLETAVTTSSEAWPRKGIHYRMHPANVPCLTAARIDCCVVANNHVLDWGRAGLRETLSSLHAAGIRTAGAGGNAQEAAAPAILDLAGGARLLVFAVAVADSGTPADWRAQSRQAGVNWLPDLTGQSADALIAQILQYRGQKDRVSVSIHWGGNWGYAIPDDQTIFARRLIDDAGVDVVHGHSSHHAKGIEVYRGRPVLYGCGDLLNDYEGIGGYERFRGDLGLLYLVSLDAASGELTQFSMIPSCIRRFAVRRAAAADVAWMCARLDRECERFGAHVVRQPDDVLTLVWSA